MSRTTFSGPVRSLGGFEGNMISGTVSASTVSASTLVVGGSLTLGSGWNAISGTVSAAIGFIPVNVGGVTKYIQLFSSMTP